MTEGTIVLLCMIPVVYFVGLMVWATVGLWRLERRGGPVKGKSLP